MRFAVGDCWPGFRGRHGLFLLLCPLARSPLDCATATRCRNDRTRLGPEPQLWTTRPDCEPVDTGESQTKFLIADSIRWLSGGGVSSLGKPRLLQLLQV